MNELQKSPPPWIWRWLGLGAVVLLLASIAIIALISAGVFDPQPVGELQGRIQLETRPLSPGEQFQEWLEEPQVAEAFTLRLVAALQDGDADVGYGLAVGEPDDHLVAAVSPLGYVTVWHFTTSGGPQPLLPWQTWPHVRTGDGANEVELKREAGQITVRINRELLWQGELTLQAGGVALYGESFAGEATIAYEELVWWGPGVR